MMKYIPDEEVISKGKKVRVMPGDRMKKVMPSDGPVKNQKMIKKHMGLAGCK